MTKKQILEKLYSRLRYYERFKRQSNREGMMESMKFYYGAEMAICYVIRLFENGGKNEEKF